MKPGMTRWTEEPCSARKRNQVKILRRGKQTRQLYHLEVQLLARAANASLARAQLAKVLRSLGHNVRAQLQRKQMIENLSYMKRFQGFKECGPQQLEEHAAEAGRG